jgi:hypothetical protein
VALREALCRECSATIHFVTLPPRPGDPAPSHPVDYAVQADPLVGRLVVNPRSNGARVLTKDDIDSGRAARWLAAGGQVHESHYFTCPAAKADRNPNQEAMF